MNRKVKIALLSVLGILAVLVLALILFIATFDANRLKGFVTARAGEALGRELTIDGDIDIDWGWVPRITLNQVRLANADWSEDENMAEVERLTASIKLRDLLRGRIVLPNVELERPRLVLEKNEAGEANWNFSPVADAAAPDDRTEVPVVENLRITEGEIIYRDPARDLDIETQISTVVAEGDDGEERVELTGTGTMAGEPFELAVEAGALLNLRDPDEPYPLKGTVTVGDTELALDGTLLQPTEFGGMDFSMAISGADVGALFPLIGFPAPTTPPYDIKGQLTRDGDVWRVEELNGTIGDSDIAGTIAIDTGRERPLITGDLRSNQLDFDDLAGLVGAPTGTGEGETASPQQIQAAEAYAARDRLLPQATIDFEKIRAVDAQVRFEGAGVELPGVPLEGVTANIDLKDGVLRVDPLGIGIAGGRVESAVTIDAREDPASVAVDMRVDGFDLAQVRDGTVGTGEIIGRATLQGWGNSVAAALATANGQLALLMDDGTVSPLMLELLGIDIAEALGFVLTEDDAAVPVRCGVLDFGIEDGLMLSRTIIFDTTDTNLYGEGGTNFKDEVLHLELLAQPKDPSLFSARAPLRVSGPYKDLSVGVDAAALGLRAGAAVALSALLTPLAGALAFLEPGTGEDSPCAALINEAEQTIEGEQAQ